MWVLILVSVRVAGHFGSVSEACGVNWSWGNELKKQKVVAPKAVHRQIKLLKQTNSNYLDA